MENNKDAETTINPQDYISEARKKDKYEWDEAREIYNKARRIYLDNKSAHKEELASLSLEMAVKAFQAETWQNMTGKKTLAEDTSATLTYLIESNNLYNELNNEDPGRFGYQTALILSYFAKLYSYLIDDEFACVSEQDVNEKFEKAVVNFKAIESKTEEIEIAFVDLLISYSIFCNERLTDCTRSFNTAVEAEKILLSATSKNPDICSDPYIEEYFTDISDLKEMNT